MAIWTKLAQRAYREAQRRLQPDAPIAASPEPVESLNGAPTRPADHKTNRADPKSARLDAYVDLCAVVSGTHIVLVGWIYNPDAPVELLIRREGSVATEPPLVVRGKRPDVSRRLGDHTAPWGFVVIAKCIDRIRPNEHLEVLVSSGEARRDIRCTVRRCTVDDIVACATDFTFDERAELTSVLREAGLDVPPNEAGAGLSELASFVDGRVDLAIAIPGEGVFLAGWLLDPKDSIAALHLRCEGITSSNILGELARFERKDVTELHGAHQKPRLPAGLLGFVPLPEVDRRGPRAELVVVTRRGEHANLPVPFNAQHNEDAVVRDLLASVEPETKGALARLQHVATAVSALRKARRTVTSEPTTTEFGTPPVSPPCSLVIPLAKRRALLQQLSHFAHDPELSQAEVLCVVQDPVTEEDIIEDLASYHPVFGVPIRLVCPGRRVSAAEARNIGVKYATGTYVVLLGSDVVPKESGWVGRMRGQLDTLPDAAAVGARILGPDDSIAQDGLEFERSEDVPSIIYPLLVDAAMPKSNVSDAGVTEVRALTGDCLVLRRDLFDHLGGLDDGFVRDGFALVDFCFKASAAGRRSYVVRNEEVRRLRPATKDEEPREAQRLEVGRVLASSYRLQQRWPAVIDAIARDLPEVPARKKRPEEIAREKRRAKRAISLALRRGPGELRGKIDVLSSSTVEGWVKDIAAIEAPPVVLDVYIDEEWVAEVVADEPHATARARSGFKAYLPQRLSSVPSFVLELRARGANEPVLGTPIHYHDSRLGIGLLQELGHALRSGKLVLDALDGELAIRQVIPKLIASLRVGAVETFQDPVQVVTGPTSGTTVIVPVYDGFDETMRCLDALVASRPANKTSFEILVVDDCGPSPSLRDRLQALGREGTVRLVVNERNLGFVKSVNRALRLSVGRDVVLLNADAVVQGDWLDRLQTAAYSSPSIASVTPLSNDATICSYPNAPDGGGMPEGMTLEDLDAICQGHNKGLYVTIPTGVGFCMYMRSRAIDEVGVLDEEKFGRGYGEENDWCLRALDRGFRHLCACDVFVEHLGGVSFGKAEKSQLVQRNLAVLNDAYPEYAQLVTTFIQKDPIRIARNNIARARLLRILKRAKDRILYVSHGLGGGIDLHCRDMIERLGEEGVAVLTLEPVGDLTLELRHEDVTLRYAKDEVLRALAADLEVLGVTLVHLHSDIGFGGDIWELPWRLRVPFDVTLHDYLAVCPRVNFTDPLGRYCREPSDPAECHNCVATHSTYRGLQSRYAKLGGTVMSWRAAYGDRLFRARKIFAPNEDVAERFGRYFSDIVIDVKAHPMDAVTVNLGPPAHPGALHKVAVIGAIGPHKGYETLLGCARDAIERKLPLEFVVVGFSSDDDELAEMPNVLITGSYNEEALPDLLRAERYGAALFLSEWPETFSYTVAEALRAGIPPVCLDIGAPANRLRKIGVGRLVALGATPSAINDALLETAQNPQSRRVELSEGRYGSLLEEYYGLSGPTS